ncbi:hypothetical protein [Streptomyces resistomycificus]|uniref:hypothetical protein n=1 Tax=Streptomyces resistomycificus TaxID=67356 RepID=UPI00068AE177|nr:hypothetical protein [Streptomyces resistomycificus]KUN99539.1 hypothetical protein AQJ84_11365 [Streptomyces resistomycificus]
MSTSSITITTETARHVLWRYDRCGGAQPGTFTQHLMAAIESADVRNRAILRDAYPELSEALHLARYDEDGLAKLQAAAAIRCTRCQGTDGPFVPAGLCEACARPMPLDGVA